MIDNGFEGKLLHKLSAIEHSRLEAEAVRKKNTPRPKSTLWSDIRQAFSWQWRRYLRLNCAILAWFVIAVLAANSPVFFIVWVLVFCLAVIYGVCRILYAILNSAYGFVAWKGRK